MFCMFSPIKNVKCLNMFPHVPYENMSGGVRSLLKKLDLDVFKIVHILKNTLSKCFCMYSPPG